MLIVVKQLTNYNIGFYYYYYYYYYLEIENHKLVTSYCKANYIFILRPNDVDLYYFNKVIDSLIFSQVLSSRLILQVHYQYILTCIIVQAYIFWLIHSYKAINIFSDLFIIT